MRNSEIANYIKSMKHYSGELVIADSAEPKSIDDIKDEGIVISGAPRARTQSTTV